MYQGFDIKSIIKLMIVAQRERDYDSRTKIETYYEGNVIVDGQRFLFTYYTNRELMMGRFFIIFFAIRGSVWTKVENKSSVVMKKILEMLKIRYNTDTNSRSPLSQVNVITVPRICVCFPHKICDLFHYGYDKMLCTL